MADDVMDAWIESEAGAWVEAGAPWTEDDPYHAALRGVVAPQYRHLPAEQLDLIVEQMMESLPPLEAESFGKFLSNLGKTVAPIAAKVLPIAAPIVGTVIGGPAGTAIGGALGQLAGQAIGGAVPMAPARPTAPRPPAPRPRPPATGTTGSVAGAFGQTPAPAPAGGAVGQLLSFLQNPALLQSIAGQMLGPAGARSVPVGPNGVPAPFGAFMNALSVLANQAASEAEGYGEPDESEATAYLRDGAGQFVHDPAVAEDRAAALLELLRAGEGVGGAAESEWHAEGNGNGSRREGVGDWLARAGMLQ